MPNRPKELRASLSRGPGPCQCQLGEISPRPFGPLADTVERLAAPARARSRASRSALGGGITNHNYRARFAGREVVMRLPGKDTELLEIDRRAERRGERARGPGGVAPGCRRDARGPARAWSPTSSRGRRWSAAELRRAAAARRGGGGAAAGSTSCGEDAALASTPSAWSRTTPRATRERGGELPPAYEGAARGGGADRGGARRLGRRARSSATTTSSPPTSSTRRGRDPHRRLGVRGDGQPLVRPRQLRRQQRARPGRGGGLPRRLSGRARRPPPSSRRCG